MPFTLHPQLDEDTLTAGDLPLCRVLLMNNATFPWIILVPRCENARELFDLESADYATTMDEVRFAAKGFSLLTSAHKMNIAALGNKVPQLHIHIIARFEDDAAWPHPVWSHEGVSMGYMPQDGAALMDKIRRALQLS
jgi:diadenosine tetraphosphate (Ap4A) HIT family hydrolase